ncbi:19115_t:CDS:1, partial [Cetraspora pellucida]
DMLKIEELLNLNATSFTDSLDEIIFELFQEEYIIQTNDIENSKEKDLNIEKVINAMLK